MRKYRLLVLMIFIVFGMNSCSCNRTGKPAKHEKAIKKSDINVVIKRFEKALYACNPEQLERELATLEQQYPLFYPVYYNDVLSIPDMGDKNRQLEVMKDFLTKKAMKGLYDTVQQHFPDLDFLEKDLQVLFTNYKGYFPEKPVPEVVTCISEFAYSVFTVSDSILGISLDKYLGPQYIYYGSVFQEYTFMIPTFDRKYMAIDCANVLTANILPAPADKSTLLDKMITEGKLLYSIESMLPEKKENDIIKYTPKQWQWCLDNEQQIWAFFLERDLLYDTKFEQIKYIKDAPNTYGMPNTSPGKVGGWLGWQIVRKYMQQNPDMTLKQLYAVTDGQKILTASGYKPRSR